MMRDTSVRFTGHSLQQFIKKWSFVRVVTRLRNISVIFDTLTLVKYKVGVITLSGLKVFPLFLENGNIFLSVPSY